MDTITLAVDGAHGIYVPKRFFALYPQFLDCLNEDDQAIIDNPEHAQYFEVWDEFTSNFERMKDGVRWYIYQDGDVFFVSEHHNFED